MNSAATHTRTRVTIASVATAPGIGSRCAVGAHRHRRRSQTCGGRPPIGEVHRVADDRAGHAVAAAAPRPSSAPTMLMTSMPALRSSVLNVGVAVVGVDPRPATRRPGWRRCPTACARAGSRCRRSRRRAASSSRAPCATTSTKGFFSRGTRRRSDDCSAVRRCRRLGRVGREQHAVAVGEGEHRVRCIAARILGIAATITRSAAPF